MKNLLSIFLITFVSLTYGRDTIPEPLDQFTNDELKCNFYLYSLLGQLNDKADNESRFASSYFKGAISQYTGTFFIDSKKTIPATVLDRKTKGESTPPPVFLKKDFKRHLADQYGGGRIFNDEVLSNFKKTYLLQCLSSLGKDFKRADIRKTEGLVETSFFDDCKRTRIKAIKSFSELYKNNLPEEFFKKNADTSICKEFTNSVNLARFNRSSFKDAVRLNGSGTLYSEEYFKRLKQKESEKSSLEGCSSDVSSVDRNSTKESLSEKISRKTESDIVTQE